MQERHSFLRAFVPIFFALVLVILGGIPAHTQTIQPPFDTDYTFTDLGRVPGLPPPYGGLTFLLGDPNTILIGGNANQAAGKLYSIGVVRDVDDHIIGFSGTASVFADAAFNDGGVAYGPDDVLFLARWPVNQLGQTRPGSAGTDKVIALGPLGVGGGGPGGLNFVPLGFAGAGQLKIVAWPSGEWYTLGIAPDGAGTFDVTSVTLETVIAGGPEGLVYVPPGSPVFSGLGLEVLVAEFSAGNVVAYEIDTNSDPIPTSRTLFITGLSGAEGAVIDPLTGDFLFSTFGGGDRVLVVQGFVPPPPQNEPPVALCQDVTVSADNECLACASVDDGSFDPDGDPITVIEEPGCDYSLGSTLVTLTVDDGLDSDSCQGTVTVVDTTPPSIQWVAASPSVLWPPNHKMVPVIVSASVSDFCDRTPVCQITSVSSNEPINGPGDGNTSPDWEITGDLRVNLRAERSGSGTGRIYTIAVQCTDASGNRSTAAVPVAVPHDRGKGNKK